MPILQDDKETLPDITEDAPVLLQEAKISKEKLEEDLRPYTEEVIVVPEEVIPVHHLECAYKKLIKGATVQDAARIACIPEEKAQEIFDEIATIKIKLSTATPKNKKINIEERLPIEQELGK